MEVVILANRRRFAPYGLSGGESGALGENWVEHLEGHKTILQATGKSEVKPGDIFVLHTPGGGGYGRKK